MRQGEFTVSVIVVTRDRPELLQRLLGSLVAQTRPADEVLIVNNGSTRSYESVFAEFDPHLPLRTVMEANPGIPQARNRGIAEAKGEIIVFTDDDCVAESTWLERIVAPFRLNPHIGAVGGEIESDQRTGSLVEEFCAAETLMRMGRKEAT